MSLLPVVKRKRGEFGGSRWSTNRARCTAIEYKEISSCSNFEAYQVRHASIRFLTCPDFFCICRATVAYLFYANDGLP
jgi:hypothetical protein